MSFCDLKVGAKYFILVVNKDNRKGVNEKLKKGHILAMARKKAELLAVKIEDGVEVGLSKVEIKTVA